MFVKHILQTHLAMVGYLKGFVYDFEVTRVLNQSRALDYVFDNLSKAGWSSGCVSAIDCSGRNVWIADAHRGDGRESQEI
jgi:hypothetical protein